MRDADGLFAHHPADIRDRLTALRDVILGIAGEENVGPVEETVKWGQPAFLCKTGTTIRIDRDKTHDGAVVLYVHCQTSLVGEWRDRFPDMTFGGNRSLHLARGDDLADPRLRQCIVDALTYHRRAGRRA